MRYQVKRVLMKSHSHGQNSRLEIAVMTEITVKIAVMINTPQMNGGIDNRFSFSLLANNRTPRDLFRQHPKNRKR